MTASPTSPPVTWNDTFEERQAWLADYRKHKSLREKAGRREIAVWYAALWIREADARNRSRNPLTSLETHQGALDAMIHAAGERVWRRFRRDRPVEDYKAMLVEETGSYPKPTPQLTADPGTWSGYSCSPAIRRMHAVFLANSKRTQEIVARVGNLDVPPKARPILTLKAAQKN